jgi:hypothetical protein
VLLKGGNSKIRLGLAAKLAICVIVSTAAFFALFGFINLKVERAESQELVVQAADRITDVIQRSTHYEMLRHDPDALHNMIQQMGSEPGIRRIRIFNKDGRITLSTDGGTEPPPTVARFLRQAGRASPGSDAADLQRARVFERRLSRA